MIASFGMYDRPETAGANDRLWALVREGLRGRGIAAPDTLTRGAGAYWPAWQDPALVLSQTCGFPYRARLHGRVTLVGTGDHRLPGCPAGHYRSVLIAPAADGRDGLAAFDGAALAYNEALSQSGWAAPMTHAATLGLRWRAGLQTGSHRASVEAIAEGRADLAAIDALTFRNLTRWEPALTDRVRVLGHTPPTPALPFIAGPGADAAATFAALAGAIAQLSHEDCETLALHTLVAIPAGDYLAVPTPPPPDGEAPEK